MLALVVVGLVACGSTSSVSPAGDVSEGAPAADAPAVDARADGPAPRPPPVDVFAKDVPVPDGDVTVVVPLPSAVVGPGRVEPGVRVDVGATIPVKDHAQTIVARTHLLVTHVERDGRATVAASPDDAAGIEKVVGQGSPFALLDDGDLRVVYVDDGAAKALPLSPGDAVAVDLYLTAGGDGTTAEILDGVRVHDVVGVSVGLVVTPDQGVTVANASRLGPIVLAPSRVAPSDAEPTAPSPQKGIVPISPSPPG